MASMRLAVLLFSVATLGCVQRAILTPPIVLPTQVPVAETVDVAPRTANTKQYVIRPHSSSVEVLAVDLVTGNHTLVFRDFRGTLVVSEPPTSGELKLNVDLRDLTTGSEMVTGIIRDELLEVTLHPFAKLVASLRPGDEPDERAVRGNMQLHGVERGIHFVGTLRREGEGYQFSTSFYMSRAAFGIRRDPDLDWMIFDDFLVRFNLRATPEVVTVEIMDSPAAP